jgi:hypothetical protein
MGGEVARLVDEVDQSKEGVNEALTLMKAALGKVEIVEKDKNTDKTKVREVLTWIMKRVQSIGPEIEAIRAKVVSIDVEIGKHPKSMRSKTSGPDTHSSRNPMMDDLMEMIGGGQSLSAGAYREDAYNKGGTCDEAFALRTEEDLRRVTGEIEKLVREVGILKASTEDKSIKFGGL